MLRGLMPEVTFYKALVNNRGDTQDHILVKQLFYINIKDTETTTF